MTSRDHALNNAVKSSKKHSSSAQSSPVQISIIILLIYTKYVKGVMEYNYIILLIILSVDVDL